MNRETLLEALEEVLEEQNIDLIEEEYSGCGGYETTHHYVEDIVDDIISKYKTKSRDKKLNQLIN